MKFIFLSWMLLAGLPAFGANAEIIMPIPKSGITIPQSEPSHAVAPTYFELNTSSWAPNGIETPSRLDSTGLFVKAKSSRLSFNVNIGEWDTSYGFVSPKLGVSYLALSRSGFLRFANSGYWVDQDLALYQGRVGLEWIPHSDLVAQLRPFAALSILPLWLQSPASQFDDGLSEVRWMGELAGGLSYNFKSVANAMGFSLVAATVGLETTQFLSSNEMAGTGLTAGLRMSWN